MIEVRHPRSWLPERRYVLTVLLVEWLGLDVSFVEDDRVDTQISRTGAPNFLTIADGLFSSAEEQGLTERSIPQPPFPGWRVGDSILSARLITDVLPLIDAATPDRPVTIADGWAALNFDLLGGVFAALTRYEEQVCPERDRHGRFPLRASLAWRAGFQERPLADEYCSVLAWALWKAGVVDTIPGPPDAYRVHLTHDVDRPVSALEDGMRGLLRRTAADVVIRRDVPLAGSRLASYRRARHGDPSSDPSYSFDFLMDVAEGVGQQATFNVLARASDQAGRVPTSELDARYRLTDRYMGSLIGHILERGHAIGLHGSYNSYASAEQVVLEMEQLRAAVGRTGFDPGAFPARQHYLRWVPETWNHLAAAGAVYDSTVGYAEAPGFRSGTCRPHSVFDVARRMPVALSEHPLIIMDVSLDPVSLQRGAVDSVATQVEGVVSACRRMRGELVMLWHNNNVAGKRGKTLYHELVELTTSNARS